MHFSRKVKDEWLASGKPIQFFKEIKTIANLSWSVYSTPDKDEYLTMLSQEMLHSKDLSKIIKDTYESNVLENINVN